MARRDRSRRGDLPLTADINVTSLVDVAFTLLVIFIITAPALQGGIEVDVPEADVRPLTTVDDPFFVTIARDGQVYLEETPVSAEDFRTGFVQLLGASDVDRVFVRGDSLAPYGRMLQVVGLLTTAGVDFSLVAEPWPQD